MKTFILAAAVAALTLTSAMATVPEHCTILKANWQNAPTHQCDVIVGRDGNRKSFKHKTPAAM